MQIEPIVIACEQSGNHELMSLGKIIRQTGNVNEKDSKGCTVLVKAMLCDNMEIFDLLLAHPDILVNEKATDKGAALISAAFLAKMHYTIKLLRHPNILVNEKDQYGQTVLIFLAHHGLTEDINTILSRPDILVNDKDNHGDTAFIMATCHAVEYTSFSANSLMILASISELTINEERLF